MSKLKFFLIIGVCIIIALAVLPVPAQKVLEVAPGVPRHETIIIENPEGRIVNPGRFNWWGEEEVGLLDSNNLPSIRCGT